MIEIAFLKKVGWPARNRSKNCDRLQSGISPCSADVAHFTVCRLPADSSSVATSIRITGVLSLLKTRWPMATKGNTCCPSHIATGNLRCEGDHASSTL